MGPRAARRGPIPRGIWSPTAANGPERGARALARVGNGRGRRTITTNVAPLLVLARRRAAGRVGGHRRHAVGVAVGRVAAAVRLGVRDARRDALLELHDLETRRADLARLTV